MNELNLGLPSFCKVGWRVIARSNEFEERDGFRFSRNSSQMTHFGWMFVYGVTKAALMSRIAESRRCASEKV